MIAPPAGSIRARSGLMRCRSAAMVAGSDARIAWIQAIRSRVSIRRSSIAAGRTLIRFEAVPPTATISPGVASGAARTASIAARRIAASSVGVGGSCWT